MAIFLEKRREGNRFSFINRFPDFGGLYYGPLFLYFVYLGNVIYIGRGIFLGRVTFSLNPWVYSLRKLIRLSKGKEIIRGRAFPRAGLSEASLSFSQGKEVASRSKGGLRISKDIMPVIMHKKKSGKIIIK